MNHPHFCGLRRGSCRPNTHTLYNYQHAKPLHVFFSNYRGVCGVFGSFSVCCWVARGVRSPASLPAASLRVRPLWSRSWPRPPLRRVGSAVLGSVGLRAVVCFLVGFQCVAPCSFWRLGRLFWLLGRSFWGLGCWVPALFFRIFVSWLVPAPLVRARSPRLLPCLVLSGSLACSVGSRWRFSVSRSRLGSAVRSAWPRPARVSPPGSAAILVALGGLAGRSLLPALPRWGCRWVRGAFPRLASSCRSFLSFF